MVHWWQLTQLPDSHLGQHDCALVNLACAQGLPGADSLNVTALVGTLDQWAEQVRRDTQAVAALFRRDPGEFNHSWAFFRAVDLATVLQRDIGVRYHPALIAREDFFADSSNLFVHGVISSKCGTCSSLPPLCVAIGRRLGYPLKLAATKYHLFARWDDPSGERFNLECTSLGLNSYPDDYYLEWPTATTPGEAETHGFLESLSPRRELATFLALRGHCCLDNGRDREAAEAYSAARRLEPWNPLHARALAGVLRGRGKDYGKRERTKPAGERHDDHEHDRDPLPL